MLQKRARTRHYRTLTLLAVVGAVVISGCGSSSSSGSGTHTGGVKAQGASGDPSLTVEINRQDALFSYTYVALQNGYFQKAGVNVKVVSTLASALPLLGAGKIDLLWFNSAAALTLGSEGKPTSLIYNFQGCGATADLAVLKSSPYHTLKDLSGQRVQGNILGQAIYGYALRYSQESVEQGGKPFKILTTQLDVPTINAELSSGQVAAAVGPEGWFDAGLKAGKLRLLVDTSKPGICKQFYGGYFAENSLMGLTSNLQKKRVAVVRFLEAIDMARAWVAGHPAAQVAALLLKQPSFKGQTLATQTDSAQDNGLFFTPYRGFITPAMWTHTTQLMATWGLPFSVKPYTYSKVVDMSYLTSALKSQAGSPGGLTGVPSYFVPQVKG